MIRIMHSRFRFMIRIMHSPLAGVKALAINILSFVMSF